VIDKDNKPQSVEALIAGMHEELGETVPAETPRKKKGAGRSPRHVAMDVLAYREHSRLELEEKITKKLAHKLEAGDISSEDICVALDELVEDGLLDDGRFAEAFINSRVRRGQGPVRIRRDLRQKGISTALLEAAFSKLEVNWAQKAAEVRQKRFGAELPQEYKERAKQARFLQYRGFSSEQIQSALKDFFEE
jgi:regulatory protein